MNFSGKYDDVLFILQRRLSDGTIVEDDYQGAWLLVDNGYLPWSVLVPPSKHSTTYAELRVSKWLESLRKDVECTFGIMKGRFRILKTGIPLHGVGVCDRVWATCCALHNFFLKEDNLDEMWDASKYLFLEGGHEERDVQHYLSAENPRDALAGMHGYDQSGMGAGSEDGTIPLASIEEAKEDSMMSASSHTCVRKMKRDDFKARLIEHFDILWRKNQIKWPSRTGSEAPSPVTERCRNSAI